MAACTGAGSIMPRFLRTSSNSATAPESPATKPARYPARFERFDSDPTASTPAVAPSLMRGSRTEYAWPSQQNSP